MIHIDIQKQLYGSNGTMDLALNLTIKEGTFLAIAGESGSGKTTFLRILAGLEEAEGTLQIGDELWLKEHKALAPQKRKIGFVFQEYALFPNLTVEENLLFVQKDKALAQELLEMTELLNLKNSLPNTLSGGQKQRVALCRALMNRPKILLMDEPLSALDPNMRTKLQHEILALHKKFGTTTIMVSHDPSEIYRLAQEMIVMEQGKIIQRGKPKEILLKSSGSQKFSFEGELLEIIKVDIIYIAIIAIGQQLVEVVIGEDEVKALTIGQSVHVGTKAFSPTIFY